MSTSSSSLYAHMYKKEQKALLSKNPKTTTNKCKPPSSMNDFIFNNCDFLNTLKKRKSQTPNKPSTKHVKSPSNNFHKDTKKLNSTNSATNIKVYPQTANSSDFQRANLKNGKHTKRVTSSIITDKFLLKNQDKILREMNTSPLLRNKKFITKNNIYNDNDSSNNNNTIKGKLKKHYSTQNINNRKTNIEYIVSPKSEFNRKVKSKINEHKELTVNKQQDDHTLNKNDNNENTNIKIESNTIDVNANISNNNNNNIKIVKQLEKSSSVPNMMPKKKKIVKRIQKIETLSQVGFSGPGVKKYNQDNYFIFKNLNDEQDTFYIGVCDGHGLVGHDVSKFLITHLPHNLNNELKKTNKYIKDKNNLYKVLKDVFINTNKSLCQTPAIDTKFSGSTCVTIILTKNKIISANAGDSRAVLGRFDSAQNKWISLDLSRDHKPNDKDESERILKKGGRIEAYKDEHGGDLGPPRVWLQHEDIPGLAMSRSFGDEVAASVGTISEPEIKEFDLTADDRFIVIASDGIWEFISSEECINIVGGYYRKKDLKGCLKYLLNESSKRWIKEEEVIDDITAVILFFEEEE